MGEREAEMSNWGSEHQYDVPRSPEQEDAYSGIESYGGKMTRYDVCVTRAPDEQDEQQDPGPDFDDSVPDQSMDQEIAAEIEYEKQDPTVTVVISLEGGNVSVLADSPDFVRVILCDYDHDKMIQPTVEEIQAAQLDDLLETLPPEVAL